MYIFSFFSTNLLFKYTNDFFIYMQKFTKKISEIDGPTVGFDRGWDILAQISGTQLYFRYHS